MNERLEGSVIHWKADRGYGFVRPDDGSPDVFLHMGEVESGGSVRANTRVTFAVISTDRGPKAVKVRVLGRTGRGSGSRRTSVLTAPARPLTDDGMADVLTEEEFRLELLEPLSGVQHALEELVGIAQRHGWVEG